MLHLSLQASLMWGGWIYTISINFPDRWWNATMAGFFLSTALVLSYNALELWFARYRMSRIGQNRQTFVLIWSHEGIFFLDIS